MLRDPRIDLNLQRPGGIPSESATHYRRLKRSPLLAIVQSALRLAVRNIIRHRGRSLIALSAIGFSVIALSLAAGFVEWVYWATREAAIQTGLGHIQVVRPGY